MKGLMVAPEDAMQLLLDRKWVEAQPVRTDFRGPVVICADAGPKAAGTIAGHALCVVNLASVEPFAKDLLEPAGLKAMPAKGTFAWVFDDLDWIEPIELGALGDTTPGPQGLFDLDGKLVNRLSADMDSVQALRAYYELLLTWADSKRSEEQTRRWWEEELRDFS
jgi:hypothetical protein